MIYEIINIGKGVITAITPENLLLIESSEIRGSKLYTVSNLPSGSLNEIAIVSDALTPTYLGIINGGGFVVCPVWHNGVNWVAR